MRENPIGSSAITNLNNFDFVTYNLSIVKFILEKGLYRFICSINFFLLAIFFFIFIFGLVRLVQCSVFLYVKILYNIICNILHSFLVYYYYCVDLIIVMFLIVYIDFIVTIRKRNIQNKLSRLLSLHNI